MEGSLEPGLLLVLIAFNPVHASMYPCHLFPAQPTLLRRRQRQKVPFKCMSTHLDCITSHHLSISWTVHPCMDRVNIEALMTNILERTEWDEKLRTNNEESTSRQVDPMPQMALWWHKHFIIYLYSSSVAKTWILYMDLFISPEISWNKKQTIENSMYTTEGSVCTSERVNKKSCHMDCGRTFWMSVIQTHCKLTKTQYFATCLICYVPYCQEPLFYHLLYSLFFA